MRAIRAAATVVLVLAAAGCGPGSPGGAGQDRGAVIYATHCASCHQRDGRGVANAQPPLAGSVTVNGDPGVLIAWVLLGKRPATLPPRRGLAVMPQFFWLGDEDVAAVLTHIRAGFGNSAPAVTAAEVAAVRSAAGQP
jgi:mono/diheme cytochrome c family protein